MGKSKTKIVTESVDRVNVVVIDGVVKTDPAVREIADGEYVREFVVGSCVNGRQIKAPVSCAESLGESLSVGDQVTVIGQVQMRFFAAGGRVVSRTEVVASQIFSSRSKAARTKALSRVIEAIESV